MKIASALVTATALLVLTLATPAEALGSVELGPSARVTLPNGPMGVATPKAQWGIDAKHPVLSHPKSVLGKQPLAGETGKGLDTFGK